MFNHPYSIYIDKRPIRIAFLVDSSSASTEIVDQIIGYNQSLWGGRFNPIMLTDGHALEDKWWRFLRDIDPDIIKPLVSLDIELIEKFGNFLSPLIVEQFRENERAHLGVRVNTNNTPAGININSLISSELGTLHEKPTLGIFNLDEMDDDIAKNFVLHNFGTFQPSSTIYLGGRIFNVSVSLENGLQCGVVPPEVHEDFEKNSIPLSKELFSKKSVQMPESWAIMDKENGQVHYINVNRHQLGIRETRYFRKDFGKIDKKVYLITDRKSLADALLELAHTPNIVFRDQLCALPNTERECEKDTWADRFEVIIGDTLQDIIYSWNRPLLVRRWERSFINHMWLPTSLAKDADMEEAIHTWIARGINLGNQTPKTVRFVSFSVERRELEDIAGRFRENPRVRHRQIRIETDCFEEPQIPSFRPENPLFFQEDNLFSSRENTIGIHRVQGNEGILELTEPREIAHHGLAGHWMNDFYIEFTHDMYEDHEYVVEVLGKTLFWRFPNQNHLMHDMFDKPGRIKQNGFPSIMMQSGKNVLRFTLKEATSVVASLFRRVWIPAYRHGDPRAQVTTKRYDSVGISDKGKYLQGVLELFGSLTFAWEVLRSSYWRGMFDTLSKNTHAEQEAHRTVANKLTKLIRRAGSLTHENSAAIQSITANIVNESKKLLRQKELPFDAFMQEAKDWQNKYMENMVLAGDQSEGDVMDCRSEDVRGALAELAQRNIVQIGVKPRCPSCGAISWYHVDDISQHLTCQGCRIQFPLPPQLTWHYKLNELIHAAHAQHGTTPVILVLGQLLQESRTSFLFSPNLDLLTEPQAESSERLNKTAEVDIACIQDGKFIIGEVKQSMSLFRPSDFDTVAEIAERVKPDIVLFSCMDLQQPTENIDNHIKRIGERLSPLEIDVKWYELIYIDYGIRI